MEYYLSVKNNEVINAICSIMNGPRDCHTERNKSDREGELSDDIPYMWNLKRNDTNELIYKTVTDLRRMNLSFPGGKHGVKRELGSLGRSCTHCFI